MEKQLWYHKHRPKLVSEYVFKDEDLKDRVVRWVKEETLPHLVITGPPGTGKTTLAHVIRASMGVEPEDFLFINASLNRGIDTVRSDIVGFAENGGWGGIRLVVLDEADQLSTVAQDSLRGVMDTYSDSVRFIFTGNRLQGISQAIRSRAMCFVMDALDEDQYAMRLMEILEAEGYDSQASMDALVTVCERHYPDLRKAIDTLQEAAGDDKVVTLSDGGGDEEKGWESELRRLVGVKAPVTTLRQFAAGLQGAQTEEALRFLYDDDECLQQLNLTPDQFRDAYLIVADHLTRHRKMMYPDVNLVAALLKIQKL